MAQYYWVDESSTFGGGDKAVNYGDKLPKDIEKDERFQAFKDAGLISTEPVAGKRVISRLEELEAENIVLKNEKGELEKSGGGADPKAVQTALDTSTPTDLARIAELESSEAGELQGTLDLVLEAFAKVQQGDSKSEIWDAVKGVKDLLAGDE